YPRALEVLRYLRRKGASQSNLLPETQMSPRQAHWRTTARRGLLWRTARVYRILRKRAPRHSDLLLRRMHQLPARRILHLLALVAPVPMSLGSNVLVAPAHP